MISPRPSQLYWRWKQIIVASKQLATLALFLYREWLFVRQNLCGQKIAGPYCAQQWFVYPNFFLCSIEIRVQTQLEIVLVCPLEWFPRDKLSVYAVASCVSHVWVVQRRNSWCFDVLFWVRGQLMSRIQLGCNAFNAGRVGRVTELSRTALRNFIELNGGWLAL